MHNATYAMYSVLRLTCMLCIITMAASSQHAAHRCIHDEIQPSRVQRTNTNYASSAREKRSTASLYKHLRITPYYYDLSNLDSDGQEKVEIVVKKAINVVQHVLSVIPVSGPLILSRTFDDYCIGTLSSAINSGKCSVKKSGYEYDMCDDVQIPDDHLEGAWLWNSTHTAPVQVIKPQGGGISNTDIVIYVKTSDCELEGTLAHAKFCRVDQNGRPVAGVLNLCPYSLQDSTELDKYITVTIHEMFHILGFTRHLYDQFRDCAESATGLDCPTYVNTLGTDSNGQTVLQTPMVKLKSREHFNCSQRTFATPLENQVSTSHWEMRLMAGSIMAPVITQAHVTFLDPITLALFEDTGWYKSDFELAQSMPWGRNAGCNFALPDTCTESPFFCNNESISGCHYLHGDKGRCSSNNYLESCSLFTVTSNGLCTEEDEYSEDAEETGELYGMDSKCFVADLVNETFAAVDDLSGRCYRTRCDMEQRTYQILVAGSEWHTCRPNDTLPVTGYTGQVHCPSFEVICKNYSSILDLVNGLPEMPETSTLHPTTKYKEPDLAIGNDENLVIEIAFNGTSDSSTLDEHEDDNFLNAVNRMVLSTTNISQDRLEVFEAEITDDNILVTLNVQHSTAQCTIPSYVVYKSLESLVKSHKFTVVHSNKSLTATTIRIVESVVYNTPADLTGATLAVVVVFSTIGATALFFLLFFICKRKAFPQRVAPVDAYETDQADSPDETMMQPTTTRRKKSQAVDLPHIGQSK